MFGVRHHPIGQAAPGRRDAGAVLSARADGQSSNREPRLRGAAPAGPGGARGGTQAAGHVHRLDRHPRADALSVGDHRQLRRRGARAGSAGRSWSPSGPTVASRCTTAVAASRWTRNRVPACPGWRSCSPSCTPGASSAPARTTRPAGCTASGSSVVNALSSRLDVEVDRNGATYAMSFRRGVPGVFAGPGPTARFTPGGPLAKVGRARKGVTGTRVTYWPDRQIFLARRPALAEGPAGPGAADQLPGARPGPDGGRRPHQRGDRGDLPARRRHLGVLRVPRRRTRPSPM